MARQRWEDIPAEIRERWQENTRQAELRRAADVKMRRAERKRAGVGRRGRSVRCSIETLRRLKALSNARRQLALLEDSDVNYTGWRFSIAEELGRLVERAYRRTMAQLESLAESEPRARVILDTARMTAVTGS